jgi:hypothetical protein
VEPIDPRYMRDNAPFRGGPAMKTVQEYRDNAAECRQMAKRMPQPEDRIRLQEMAQAWDRLARSREGKLLAGAEPDDV